MKYELYPHQKDVIEELRRGYVAGHTRQILAMATGAGKTVVAGQIALNAVKRHKRVLFIVHLKELVIQAVQHFETIGLQVGILQGENTCYSVADEVIVASIQTIRSRKAPEWMHVAIIDECHILHKEHIRLMQDWSHVPFIGLSATPLREDLGKYFTHLVRGPTVAWLTEKKYLVPATAYCPGSEHMSGILEGIKCGTTTHGYDYNQKELGAAMNRKELVGDIVETWKQYGEDRQTLCFAVNKAHSRSIVEDFTTAGITAAHIEDKTPDSERRELISAFRDGDIRLLSSVGVLSIGFDVPDASCLILARPTKSEMLDMQQKGRGIRTAKGKTDCIMLDHAGNTLSHGLPKHFEVPDLRDNDRETSKRQKPVRKMVACSNCGFALEPDQFICPSCGVDRPKPSPKVTYLDGKLVPYGSLEDGAEKLTLDDQCSLYRQFMWYAQEHGYKPSWAYYKLRDRTGFHAPKRWMALAPRLPAPATLRWIKSQNIRWAKRTQR